MTVLQNTVIVSNGIEAEIIRKKDLQETSLLSNIFILKI